MSRYKPPHPLADKKLRREIALRGALLGLVGGVLGYLTAEGIYTLVARVFS